MGETAKLLTPNYQLEPGSFVFKKAPKNNVSIFLVYLMFPNIYICIYIYKSQDS